MLELYVQIYEIEGSSVVANFDFLPGIIYFKETKFYAKH